MTRVCKFMVATIMTIASMGAASAFAEDYSHSTPGIGGYDAVAYFTDGRALRGSGYHVTVVEGVTYAFATTEHQKMFEANPQNYLPAYGGYCAYGLGVGKKFVADPEVWKIVEGALLESGQRHTAEMGGGHLWLHQERGGQLGYAEGQEALRLVIEGIDYSPCSSTLLVLKLNQRIGERGPIHSGEDDDDDETTHQRHCVYRVCEGGSTTHGVTQAI